MGSDLREDAIAKELLDAVADYLRAVKRTFVIFEPAEDRLRVAYNAVIQRANDLAALPSTPPGLDPTFVRKLLGRHHRDMQLSARQAADWCDACWTAPDSEWAVAGQARTALAARLAQELDAERLHQAFIEELAILWGEPSDGISAQIRPIFVRQVIERYARLAQEPDPRPDNGGRTDGE